MISVYSVCAQCSGMGWIMIDPSWVLCVKCDGIGRTWAPGAPSYGHPVTLADRVPGEIVKLGNGDRGRILWHAPRGKDKRNPPTTTFLGLIDDFDFEEDAPVGYPSCVGVAAVEMSRGKGDHDHLGERGVDAGDPIQRNRNNQMF